MKGKSFEGEASSAGWSAESRDAVTERKLQLTWSRTWLDQPNDFAATDRGIRVGRIYRITGGPSGNSWRWAMYARLGNRQGTQGGNANDRDEARRAVEEHYREFRQRIGRDRA